MNQAISFGSFVRQRRREMDLTQEELARRVGCAAITLRKIEGDDLRPSVQIAERLAMALAIPLDDRAEFVRRARAVQPEASDLPAITPAPSLEEIGREDLTGRAIRGYALAERIGMGGMGSVYRAVQPNVEREVAIKIILPAYANHPDFIRRFEAEAQLVARLEHPHIVPLYDYWREPGVAYLVMRLLRGGNVQNLLGAGPLPIDMVSRLLDQICSALHAAHRIGVIHRDLKPANIMLDEDNNAYLTDFGIAKNISNPDRDNQTQIDQILGTWHYMSPEQINSFSIKPQTDIYCLGIMLYEMLTGSLPFIGPTPIDFIQQHIKAPMPPLAAHHTGLPAMLDNVIARATAKNPEQRYEDALSLYKDFRQAVSGVMDTPFIPVDVDEESDIEISNPFKGLRAFNEADAENFFGRESLVQQLLARMGEGGDLNRFLAVIGPSGSGKSSVVRAGLVPALRRGGLPDSENWFIVDMLPGKHPFEELEVALLRVAVNPPEHLLAQLKDGNRGLLRAAHRILPADEKVELVLVIDQFEEVFTLVEDEAERMLLLENLATAVLDERSRLRVVITLRADFTDKPLRYVDFGEMLNRRFEFILPLTPDELERTIVNPAKQAGLKLEKGLASVIIREVGNQPGALPLLQYALSELFDKRDGRIVTNKAYREIGGALGALGRSAESIHAELDHEGQSAARQIFLRLVTLGEGTEDTRRRVLREELESLPGNQQTEIKKVIDAFGKAHLLSFDRDPLTRGATIEVAHEALIREWSRLHEWLNESRADVRMQRQVASATNEWLESGQEASFLITGARLEQFEGWAANTTVALTQSEQAFLDASTAERDRRAQEEKAHLQRELEAAQKFAETEKRSANQLRQRAVFLGIALAIAVIAAVFAGIFGQRAVQERKIAEQQTLIASVRELSSESIASLSIDPERSVMLALEAVNKTYSINMTVLPEAEDALRRAVQISRVEQTFRGNNGPVWYAAYSPDGKMAAAAYDDGTVKIWDVTTGKELCALKASKAGWVSAVAFNPDGSLLATGAEDSSTRVWDFSTGREVRSYVGHEGGIYSVRFSPDGSKLASTGDEGSTIVWDVSTGEEILKLEEEIKGSINLWVAFSPDGTKIATASTKDYTEGWATIWDVATGRKLMTLPTDAPAVRTILYSPDGSLIVTADDARTTKIWDATSGELLRIIYHTEIPSVATFTHDGTRLISAYGRQVTAYDATTGQELFSMAGHTDSVTSISVSPDNTHIITASVDGTARIWNIIPTNEKVSLSNGPRVEHPNGTKLAFSPDGTRLVITNSDPFAEVWEVKTGQQLLRLTGHNDLVLNVAYSSDGTKIATAGNDSIAKIWDAETGKELKTLTGHTDSIFGIDFNPDGTRIATASWDTTVKVWDVATGKILLDLPKQEDWVGAVDYSPDGTHIATGNWFGITKIWDANTGELLHKMEGHSNNVRAIVFSPDGSRLVTASFDGTAKVWDVKSGQEILTLNGHTDALFDVAYSMDGTKIATVSADKTARVWDAKTGQELLTFYAPDTLTGVDFSPDGSQLAVGGRDGTTRIYYFRIEDVINIAKSRVTRTLTLEECQKYLHMDACPIAP